MNAMTKAEIESEAAWAGNALAYRAGTSYSWRISKIRGQHKKWEITFKGNSISYTYSSKAAATRGLKQMRDEANDPNDYQIRPM